MLARLKALSSPNPHISLSLCQSHRSLLHGLTNRLCEINLVEREREESNVKTSLQKQTLIHADCNFTPLGQVTLIINLASVLHKIR